MQKHPSIHISRALLALLASSALYLGLGTSAHAQSTGSGAMATATTPAVSSLPAGTAAIVNGVSIASAQVDAVLHASGQPDTPPVRQIIKDDLIAREVFRQNAEKAHYDTRPEAQQVMNAAKVQAETNLYLKDNIHPQAVTDAEVKSRYDQIVASLGKDEYKPRVISVADDATATSVLAKLRGGASFDTLARQYSVAPSRAAGGEMAWLSFKTPATDGQTQGLPLPVADALARLPVGGVTPTPITLGNLRVIVKLDAKRPTQVPSYNAAQGAIRQQLQALAAQKASAAFIGPLLKSASIQQ